MSAVKYEGVVNAPMDAVYAALLRIADRLFVDRQGQRDLEQSIANLKQILEG